MSPLFAPDCLASLDNIDCTNRIPAIASKAQPKTKKFYQGLSDRKQRYSSDLGLLRTLCSQGRVHIVNWILSFLLFLLLTQHFHLLEWSNQNYAFIYHFISWYMLRLCRLASVLEVVTMCRVTPYVLIYTRLNNTSSVPKKKSGPIT